MPFPYFGRKTRIAHLYPYPTHDTIVEPFAGSAGYAMHADNWTRRVILVEKNPQIAELWRWLISPKVDRDTIVALSDMHKGESLEDKFGNGPRRTLAELTSPSATIAKNTVTEWMERDWPGIRQRIAGEIHKVKHWTIDEGDYRDAPDIKATWFIDPPYQKIVHGYGNTRDSLDFYMLGDWCVDRSGQVIVCEESGADWLPFQPLTGRNTIDNTRTVEVVWTNYPVALF